MENTPNYIKSLLIANTKKPQGRKVWSIDLETVWIPFFTATNTMGDTSIPSEAIGCPMRLAYDKAGSVRFSANGKPVVRVAKELSDSVRMVRDNFTANLISYAGDVMTSHSEAYSKELEIASKVGEAIGNHDKAELSKAMEAIREAEAEAKANTEANTEAKELELVS